MGIIERNPMNEVLGLEPGLEPEGPVDEIGVAPDTTSLEVLQAIYRSPLHPTSRRMRAAQVALPFEHPKLAVTANFSAAGFALRMEEMMQRRGPNPNVQQSHPYEFSPIRRHVDTLLTLRCW